MCLFKKALYFFFCNFYSAENSRICQIAKEHTHTHTHTHTQEDWKHSQARCVCVKHQQNKHHNLIHSKSDWKVAKKESILISLFWNIIKHNTAHNHPPPPDWHTHTYWHTYKCSVFFVCFFTHRPRGCKNHNSQRLNKHRERRRIKVCSWSW